NINGLISSPLTTIYGGANNDAVNFNYADGVNTFTSPVAYSAVLQNARVIVNEEGGSSDALKVDDSHDSGTDSGFMTNNMIFGIGMGGLGVFYNNVESLVIDLSQGGTT